MTLDGQIKYENYYYRTKEQAIKLIKVMLNDERTVDVLVYDDEGNEKIFARNSKSIIIPVGDEIPALKVSNYKSARERLKREYFQEKILPKLKLEESLLKLKMTENDYFAACIYRYNYVYLKSEEQFNSLHDDDSYKNLTPVDYAFWFGSRASDSFNPNVIMNSSCKWARQRFNVQLIGRRCRSFG